MDKYILLLFIVCVERGAPLELRDPRENKRRV